jgi:transposase
MINILLLTLSSEQLVSNLSLANSFDNQLGSGFLTEGDWLILDNASIHQGSEVIPFIEELMEVSGIKLLFLPSYSPELNPCELIFAQIKRYIRTHVQSLEGSLFLHMLLGIAEVTHSDIVNYYNHCIYPKVILPDVTDV